MKHKWHSITSVVIVPERTGLCGAGKRDQTLAKIRGRTQTEASLVRFEAFFDYVRLDRCTSFSEKCKELRIADCMAMVGTKTKCSKCKATENSSVPIGIRARAAGDECGWFANTKWMGVRIRVTEEVRRDKKDSDRTDIKSCQSS